MASLTMPTLSTNLAYSFSSSISPFSLSSKPTFPIRRTDIKVTRNATNGDQNPSDDNGSNNGEISQMNLDRRNVLLGIGGLYGATTLGANPSAYAAPLSPTFTECHDSTDPDGKAINCCPPSATASEITEFVPTVPSVVNTRLAAHLVDSTWLDKYKKALTKMRNLDSSDPRSFTAQANAHCAYCNGGYYQDGYADSKLLLDVHFSWLFFPFHRWYLYFFEKICQNLIDDDTFALPFWNWDHPRGMYFPSIFNDPSSPLHESYRNTKHITKTIVDLNYDGTDTTDNRITMIKNNLITMYKQMVTQSTTPMCFFGKAFHAGEAKGPGMGSIESIHNNIHQWVGDPGEPHGENMGAFYSSGRDPAFYCHHGNVDRLWNIWNTVLGGQNIIDSDWLNSSFYFYNEQANPVKVYVKDCLDTTLLGYDYQAVDIPWLNSKPTARNMGMVLPSAPTPGQVFPTTLERTITVAVKRPKKSRKKKEKQRSEEELEISFEYNTGEFVKFDVYINEDNPDESWPDKTEYVGSYANAPHGHSMTATTTKSFCLTGVLEELGADNYDTILVTLVLKSGTVTIKGLKIKFDTTKTSA